MSYNNLSKVFKYVNEIGEMIVFQYSYGLLINKPVGVDSINVSLSKAHGINQIGDSIQARNIPSRPIVISGMIVGKNQSKTKERLLDVIRPDLDGTLYADEFFLKVKVVATPNITVDTNFAKFTFQLLAPYPYWQYNETEKRRISGIVPKFKFPVNLTQPYKFGELVQSKFIEVYNGGQIPVPFTLTLLAKEPCVNPKIINAETGDFLKLQKSMVANEEIIIEITHERTNVISSISGDIRGALTLDSKFLKLPLGRTIIKPEADSGLEALEVNIKYAIEKVGITA